MRTMIWKEWRENLKWAVLAMLALGLAEFYGLPSREATGLGGWVQPEYTLSGNGFKTMSLFGCAVVGLLLGLLQFLPETARDRWGALLHRPWGKRDVFWGKVTAGISLYMAVTGIAFASCASYVAFPGHYAAPFLPEMLLPGLIDIGTGGLCYLVGVIIGLDRGRWGGLRLAAGGCGLTVFFLTGHFFSFWSGVIIEIAAAAILLAAAWGSMEDPSIFGRRSLIGCSGALAVYLTAMSGFGLVVPGMWFSLPLGYDSGWDYVISEDGTPLVVETRRDVKTVTNLEGRPISDQRYTAEEIHRHTWTFFEFNGGQEETSGWSRLWQRNMVLVGENGKDGKERWYYLPRRRYFVGYSTTTRQRVAICDRDGFRTPNAAPRPFWREAGIFTDRWDPMIIGFENDLLAFSFERRRITVLHEAQEGELYGVALYFIQNDMSLALALPDGVAILSEQGKKRAFLPYTRDVLAWRAAAIVVSPSADHFFVQYVPKNNAYPYPRYLDEVGERGELLHSFRVPVPPERTSVLPPLPTVAFAWHALQSPPQSSCWPLLWKWGHPLTVASLWESRLTQENPRVRFWLWQAVVSFVLAGMAVALGGCLGLSRRAMVGWGLFVLLFNFSGLVAFFFAADWPVRANCPACGKPRRVDEAVCSHCGAAWPVPTRDGTEIHDAAEAVSGRS